MFLQKSNFIIKCEKDDESFISKIDFAKLYKEVADFFGFNKNLIIKIWLLNSVEEYVFFSNQRFENWMCAFTSFHNKIFIFSPSALEAFTIHKLNEFEGILKHEIAHIIYYYSGLNKSRIFEEGIATFLKGNHLGKEDNIYNIGNEIVRRIIELYGKDMLINFLKNTKNITSEAVSKEFPKIDVKKYEKYFSL